MHSSASYRGQLGAPVLEHLVEIGDRRPSARSGGLRSPGDAFAQTLDVLPKRVLCPARVGGAQRLSPLCCYFPSKDAPRGYGTAKRTSGPRGRTNGPLPMARTRHRAGTAGHEPRPGTRRPITLIAPLSLRPRTLPWPNHQRSIPNRSAWPPSDWGRHAFCSNSGARLPGACSRPHAGPPPACCRPRPY